MNKILGFFAVLAAILLLAGCPTKPVDEQESGVGMGEPEPGVYTAGVGAPGGYSAADLNDPRSPLSQRVIYFDYDSSEIQPQYVDVLRAHAAYVAGNSNARLTLVGHTDERGTREYNLALGALRAEAVLSFLQAEGAARSRIEIMSYGEERPANPGHSETAWAQNRRVELEY